MARLNFDAIEKTHGSLASSLEITASMAMQHLRKARKQLDTFHPTDDNQQNFLSVMRSARREILYLSARGVENAKELVDRYNRRIRRYNTTYCSSGQRLEPLRID